MNVVYSFDDKYTLQAGVSILSLLKYHQEMEKLDIWVIDNHISDSNKTLINDMVHEYGRAIEYIDLDLLTCNLKSSTTFSRSSYARLFLAERLACDRVVYIDSDTIVNGSLHFLQSIDMTDTLAAGVIDTVNTYYKYRIGLTQEDTYICNGVLILNLKLWRELEISKRCIDFIERFHGNPPHNDQGTLNYVCRGKIVPIPAQYNVMSPMFAFSVKKIKKLFLLKSYYSQDEIATAIHHPLIVHYTDEFYNRPWFKNCTHPFKRIWIDCFLHSPWKDNSLTVKKISRNCKIQNLVYRFFPFHIYLLMVRFITWRHQLSKSE